MYVEEILIRFSVNIVKPVNIPFAFHCNLSSSLCHGFKEENVMYCIPYVSVLRGLMYVMVKSTGKQWNGFFGIWEEQVIILSPIEVIVI